MSGAGAELEATTRDPGAEYAASLGGAYARVLSPALMSLGDAGGIPPSDSVTARLGARGAWGLTPSTQLQLDTQGFLSSRLGVRAEDTLAARDPFGGERIQYAAGPGAALSIVLGRRLLQRLSAGYLQEGAVYADSEEAEGIDAHTGRGSVGWTWEVGPNDRLLPDLRYVVTHFEHAVLDTNQTRGAADVHSGTAALGVGHDFSRRFSGLAEGGATVATPPTQLDSDDPVIAPSVRLSVAWARAAFRASARYGWEYTSLGPRIGFGHEHEGGVEIGFRPKDGARFRDFWVTAVARMAYGTLPVAANPPPSDDVAAAPPAQALLTTWTAAAGAKVVYPLGRGFAALGGMDLEYLRATFDPVPAAGDPTASVRITVTVGLGAALSTNRTKMLPSVPQDDGEGAQGPRGPGAQGGEVPSENATTRTETPPPAAPERNVEQERAPSWP